MDLKRYARLSSEDRLEVAVQQVAHVILASNTRVVSPDEWEAVTRRRGSEDLPAAE